MPKVNVYLPDDLAAAVREAGLSVSSICQRALADAVRELTAAREAATALRDPAFDVTQEPKVAARLSSAATPRLRRAVDRARGLARPEQLVDTELLLVGVLDESGNLGVQVLRSLGVDVADLRHAVW